MLDYVAIKVADAALSPPIADPDAAASALNAQTEALSPQDFSALDALTVLLAYGDWPKIVVRSEVRPLDTGGVVAAALSAVALLNSRGVIHAKSDTLWAVFTSQIAKLVGAGDVSPASVAAITALRTPVVPLWPVVLSGNDIVAARGLE